MPIKISVTFITEIEKSTLKFIWKYKTPWIVKAILSKKEQCWWYHNNQPQIMLQTRSNKNSMGLVQKQIWRPVEQNGGPGYESTQLCPLYFLKSTKNIWWRIDSLLNKCCW
jgi:hypothetical protein